MRESYQLIFTLHGLGEPPARIPFEERRYWLPVDSFLEFLDHVANLPQVKLTFDDGNLSDFEIALPHINKRRLHAEFFVLAGRIGKPEYLDCSQIRGLAAEGMSIGLHGMSHRSWAECNEAELEVEIDEARRRIEAVTGRSVNRAACPFGAYNARCLRKLRHSGFERVYTCDGGVAHPSEWLQSRNTLQNPARIEDIVAFVRQPPLGVRRLSRRARTLVKRLR